MFIASTSIKVLLVVGIYRRQATRLLIKAKNEGMITDLERNVGLIRTASLRNEGFQGEDESDVESIAKSSLLSFDAIAN